LQRALSASFCWAEKHKIKYHDGETCCLDDKKISKCKKYPATLIFKRAGMAIPENFKSLKLGETEFKITSFQRILGLNVYTNSSEDQYRTILNKQGYYLKPEIDRIKSLAYRLQDIKCDFMPHFLRTMVMCYFIGIMNSSASLYWLRASKKDLERLRFYYGMGVSAIVGQTAMSTLGASCCKHMSVSEDNKRMKSLLSMVGLKSLEEIAMTDAVSVIKQVVKLRPFWFERDSDGGRQRQQVDRLGIDSSFVNEFTNSHIAVEKAGLPTQISKEICDSKAVIGAVWKIACKKVILEYERKEARVKNERCFKFKYEEIWLLSKQICKIEDDNYKSKQLLSTYHAACQEHLGCLDQQARRLGNLTVSRPLRVHRSCRISPPEWYSAVGNKKVNYKFDCGKVHPESSGDERDCIGCGKPVSGYDMYVAKFKTEICQKCCRHIHTECHRVLLLAEYFTCKAITEPLADVGVKKMKVDVAASKPHRPDELCLVCGDVYDNDFDVVCTESDCKYGVHFECGEALAKFNGEEFVACEHVCNHVNYYLKPDEALTMLDGTLQEIKKVTKNLKRRGPIDYKSYDRKRKRYENPDVVCDRCGKVIGINEENHALLYCSARYMGTPIPTRDYDFSMSKYKRIRRCALGDYPP